MKRLLAKLKVFLIGDGKHLDDLPPADRFGPLDNSMEAFCKLHYGGNKPLLAILLEHAKQKRKKSIFAHAAQRYRGWYTVKQRTYCKGEG